MHSRIAASNFFVSFSSSVISFSSFGASGGSSFVGRFAPLPAGGVFSSRNGRFGDAVVLCHAGKGDGAPEEVRAEALLPALPLIPKLGGAGGT